MNFQKNDSNLSMFIHQQNKYHFESELFCKIYGKADNWICERLRERYSYSGPENQYTYILLGYTYAHLANDGYGDKLDRLLSNPIEDLITLCQETEDPLLGTGAVY